MSTPAPWGDVVALIVEQRLSVPFVVVPQQNYAVVGGTGGGSLVQANAVTQALVFSPAGGRDGVDNTGYLRRYDKNGNYTYVGVAPFGSEEFESVWKVTRFHYVGEQLQSTLVRTNIPWSTHTQGALLINATDRLMINATDALLI
jgi:hypothetical protein